MFIFMAKFLKHLSRNYHVLLLTQHRQARPIMTSSFRAEKALEELKVNPYYEKYASKIEVIKRNEPEKLVLSLESLHEQKHSEPDLPAAREGTKPQAAKSQVSTASLQNKPKQLSSIMKMECVSDKSSDEIKMIWEEYHRHKDMIAATIPFEMMEKMLHFSKRFPTFLFPLPRQQGYEFILSQFCGMEVHMTPLASFQLHKENAPECLTMVHYTELAEKGIALMRGDYNPDIIDAKQALCLANQLQLYYCQPNDKRIALMDRFMSDPSNFQHMDLVAELECITTSLCLK